MVQEYIVTTEGLEKIKKELSFLKEHKRKEVIENLAISPKIRNMKKLKMNKLLLKAEFKNWKISSNMPKL